MNRYFIALEIPEKTKKDIASFFYPPLKRQVAGNFVDAEKLHITLLFLGNVEIKQDFLDFINNLRFSVELKIGGIGAFPSLREPKVIYANVYGNVKPQLEKLYSFFDMKPKEDFTPHVTLCRVKKVIDRINEKEFQSAEFSFTADSLHIFNSDFANYYKIL